MKSKPRKAKPRSEYIDLPFGSNRTMRIHVTDSPPNNMIGQKPLNGFGMNVTRDRITAFMPKTNLDPVEAFAMALRMGDCVHLWDTEREAKERAKLDGYGKLLAFADELIELRNRLSRAIENCTAMIDDDLDEARNKLDGAIEALWPAAGFMRSWQGDPRHANEDGEGLEHLLPKASYPPSDCA